MGRKNKEIKNFPIVGIGASAGGLASFEAFFSGLPEELEPNMAFVLIQHLAPEHKSILTELIKRYTKMPVFEVVDGMKVQINSVYIIPPNRNMAILNGTLQLFEINVPRGQNMPIDNFFRSLAIDQKEKAICVILSGTGCDGTLGLKMIKGEGGIAIAQRLDSAEYTGMPSSAIQTGQVDYQLSPDEMIKHLMTYITRSKVMMHHLDEPNSVEDDKLLQKIFLLIRNKSGHDFSNYKKSMINRRIERRMAINQIVKLTDYISFLQNNNSEIDVLLNDLLIGVTSFFRDKDAYLRLEEEIIPKLFEEKESNDTLRVWCAGCSTGEEAYSLAILLQEYMEKMDMRLKIQIFATDIDRQAIEIARMGIYPSSISEDLTTERIERFFYLEPGNNAYRISKSIREMLIFSEQSIIKDPPFSKIDLISCRNLMIYLSSDLQKKLIPVFHYALKSKGILFLGIAETIGNFDHLFDVIDRKLKLYRRKEDAHGMNRSTFTQTFVPSIGKEHYNLIKDIKGEYNLKPSLKEITETAIIRETTLTGILVNEMGDILYIHGKTDLFLELGQGEVGVSNILTMAKDGLKIALKPALKNAIEKNETVRISDISIRTDRLFLKANLIIKPITKSVSSAFIPMYLIVLEEVKVPVALKAEDGMASHESTGLEEYIDELKNELRIKDQYLLAANEELETSVNELKASNEEMQSVNEELQSTNEELETSKEELQSINEELTTVNSELQIKLHDLTQVNNDMNNLLSGTNIATIFLDLDQNILRFTPTANKIINLINSDVGRPVTHIASNMIGYNHLAKDVKNVIDTLIPIRSEVNTIDGKWYEMIIQPYRTIGNVIEGVVLTFVDITTAKVTKDLLAVSEMSYRALFETAQEGILILDGETGKIKNANPFLIKLLGYSINQLLEKQIWDIGLLKDMVANKEHFSELKKHKSIRYDNLPLQTVKGDIISVEFVSNVFEIEQVKIIQCNIRVINHSIN